MSKSLLAIAIIALVTSVIMKRPAQSGEARFEAVRENVAPRLKRELHARGLRLGARVFIRVFKEERQLEVWIESSEAKRFQLFKSYAICAFSGEAGPKLAEGDRQAPEGFYFVPRSRMKPDSQFHLAFNLGYPNAYDAAHGRTGSALMVHGNCVSIGCYAMTDALIEEIYTIADAALTGGQRHFKVHCFPFRMTATRMARAETEGAEWLEFWKNLKAGYDWFEKRGTPPDVSVADGEYQFTEG